MPQEGRDAAIDLADRVHSSAIHVLRLLRTEDERLGLSAPRLSALSVLVFGGARSVGELARAEQVTDATMSRLVSDLRRLGLVDRSVDPDDRRVRRVTATERGVELLHEGRRRRVARLADAVESLAARDRRALERGTRVLSALVREAARASDG